MTDDFDYGREARQILGFSRWWLITAAVIAMAVVSPYQYVWSSIEGPLARDLTIPLPQLGIVFTFFVIFQSGSQVPAGWWRDRHGPRVLTIIAAVLAGGGYIALSYATTVWQLYLFYSLGAIGVGIVYTIAVNTALKWFPDRRGLTTGAGTMAFAGGATLFVPYVRANATIAAYSNVLRMMGVIMTVCILGASIVLQDPPDDWGSESASAQRETANERKKQIEADGGIASTTQQHFTWREMVQTWQFWLMYAMFVAISGAGLMLTAKIVSFAQHMDSSALIATLSATLLPLAGGVGRLVLGEISDRVQRRHVMAISFILCGVSLLAIVYLGTIGATVAFIITVVVATFFWSPQYTLFPSIVGEYYGEKHSSTNYALLYSGKMWGGIFGGALTGWLITITSWTTTFSIGGALAIFSGIGALLLNPP